jgi:hypothetical protein
LDGYTGRCRSNYHTVPSLSPSPPQPCGRLPHSSCFRSLHSLAGQSRPSTGAFHKSIRCRLWLCPGAKPVPARGRVDRVFHLIVNEYSTFVYPRWKLPIITNCPGGGRKIRRKSFCICCRLGPRAENRPVLAPAIRKLACSLPG